MDGREDVGRRLRPAPKAFHHELEDFPRERLAAGFEALAVSFDGVLDEGFEIRIDLALDEDPQCAEGVSPERERVPVAGGTETDAEDAGDGVEPLASASARPAGGPRERVARETGKVRLLDGVRDRGRLPALARVAGPHVALEVRELATMAVTRSHL